MNLLLAALLASPVFAVEKAVPPRPASVMAPAAPAVVTPSIPHAPATGAPVTGVPAAVAPLTTAGQALTGVSQAAQAMPGMAHLGAEVPNADPKAGDATQSESADAAFRSKAGLGPTIAVNAAPDPAAAAPSRYVARAINFYHHVFPSVAFRPDRPVEPLLVQAIDAAQESIEIALYEFKSKPILAALRRAKANGRTIRLVVDHSNMFPRGKGDKPGKRSAELQALVDEGFDLLVLRGMHKYGINHNKFMVFDRKMAEFGSYNYTDTSERNHFENVKFTDDKAHIGAFLDYWNYLRALAVPFDQAENYAWRTSSPLPPRQASPTVDVNGHKFPIWLFSPDADGEDMLVRLIGAAKDTLDLSMFSFRSTRIAEALLKAKADGVKIRILLDKSQAQGPNTKPYAQWWAAHGIEVRLLAGPNEGSTSWSEKNHNKMIVVDGKAVETGSMNWSKNGVIMNYENMHLTTDAVDVLAYQLYFGDIWLRGTPYAAPAQAPVLPTDAELIEELLLPLNP